MRPRAPDRSPVPLTATIARATIALTLLCAGCSGAPLLEIRAMQMSVERAVGPRPTRTPWPITTLADDGTITVGRELVGRLAPDGTLTAADGTALARIDASGRIFVLGTPTDGEIDPEGTLRNGTEHQLRIDLDGQVHGTHPDAPRVRVTPIAPETRRTAMFVIAIGLLTDGSAHVSVGPIPR